MFVTATADCLVPAQALKSARARHIMGQLQSLGYADWQAAPAVLRHGSDLPSALAFLLEEHIRTPAEARAFLAAAAPQPSIAIAEELAMVAQAQARAHPNPVSTSLCAGHGFCQPRPACMLPQMLPRQVPASDRRLMHPWRYGDEGVDGPAGKRTCRRCCGCRWRRWSRRSRTAAAI